VRSLSPHKNDYPRGVRIPLYGGFQRERISVLSPSFVYRKQGKFDQLDVGAYFFIYPIVYRIVVQRGIPVTKNAKGNISQDAVVVILGFNFEKLEVSYSFMISRFPSWGELRGTHEVALKYKLGINMTTNNRRRESLSLSDVYA